MKQYLTKRKREGYIDFVEVPLNWGGRHKEFIGFDIKQKEFFRLYYDNKYREHDYKKEGIDKMLKRETDILDKYSEGLDDRGIYNTSDLYNEQKIIVDFIEKYIKQLT